MYIPVKVLKELLLNKNRIQAINVSQRHDHDVSHNLKFYGSYIKK